jgi:hypothetical protein
MEILKGLSSFMSQLKAKRIALLNELHHIDESFAVLGKFTAASSAASHGTKPRHMSASARRRISLAQKARWASAKGQVPKPKRKMSVAGRKRIAAASRARWAAFRAAKRKAA